MYEEVNEDILSKAMAAIAEDKQGELNFLASQIVALPADEQAQIIRAAQTKWKRGFSVVQWRRTLRDAKPKTVVRTNKPKISIGNRDTNDVIKDAVRAIEAANVPPTLFWRGGQLVQMREKEDGRPEVQAMSKDGIWVFLSEAAVFIRHTTDGEVMMPPDRQVCDAILTLDPSQLALPSLSGVAEIPMIREDGTLVDTPGWDEVSQIYYRPAIKFAPVPDDIEGEDVAQAVELIEDLICDFPFDSQASKANAIAMLLCPVVRHLINGPTPLAVIEAPSAGTGKSMLAMLAAVLATGEPTLLPWKGEDRENEVSITSCLIGQAPVIILDNITGVLGGGSLCAALTSPSITARPLGVSKMVTMQVRTSWIATANNIRIGEDMSRRMYKIRMDAQTVSPMQRTGFLHPQLIQYARDNRARLIHALLVICRWWFKLGRPQANVKPLGSFESWHKTMASILEAAGVKGFLGNLGDYLGRDENTTEWLAFLEGLVDCFNGVDEEFTVSEVIRRLSQQQYTLRETVPSWIPVDNPGKCKQLLGLQFRKYTGNRVGEEGLYVEVAGVDAVSKANKYVVRRG